MNAYNPFTRLIFSQAPDGVVDPTIIDPLGIRAIDQICSSNAHVRAAIQHATYLVVGNGLNLKLTQPSTGRTFKMNEDMALVVEREIQPFVAEFFKHILFFGFCVYNSKESEIMEGLTIPNIPKLGSWDLIMAYREENMSKVYFVIDSGDQLRGRTIKSANTKPFGIMKGAHVAVAESPDTEGRLRSCMSGIYTHILRLYELQNDVVECSKKKASPPFVVESSSTGNNLMQNYAVGPLSAVRYTEGDILNTEEQYSAFINAKSERELHLAVASATLQRAGYGVTHPNPIDPIRPYHKTIGSSWETPFKLPHGQTVSNVPNPETISVYSRVVDEILTIIAIAVGIGKESLLPSGGRGAYAANAEMQMRETDGRVKAWQAQIVPLISQILENVWKLSDDDVIMNLSQETESINTEGIQFADGSYSLDATNDYYSSDVEKSSADYMRMLDEQLFTRFYPQDPELRVPLSNYLTDGQFQSQTRHVRLDDVQKVAKNLPDRIRVTVSFNQAPLTTTNSLIQAREQNMISDENFKSQFLNITGIPSGFMLTQEESEQQRLRDQYRTLDTTYKQGLLNLKLDALREQLPVNAGSKRARELLDNSLLDGKSPQLTENGEPQLDNPSDESESPLDNQSDVPSSKRKKTSNNQQESGGQVSKSESSRETIRNKVAGE